MWRQRVLYGAFAIAGLVGLLAADAYLSRFGLGVGVWRARLFHGSITTMLVVAMGAAAVREGAALARAVGQPFNETVALITVLLLIVFPWWVAPAATGSPGPSALADLQGSMLLLVLGFTASTVATMAQSGARGAIARVGTAFMWIVYIGFLGSFVVRLRHSLPGPGGAWLVLYFLLVVKSADIGAYATGRMIGRRKVVPGISPNKTLEGFVGGGVLAIVVAALGGRLLASAGSVPATSLAQAIYFGLVMAIAGQFGDLFESLLKRDAATKDSGRVPAFGGILDMIDSPLFAAPAAWWLLTRPVPWA